MNESDFQQLSSVQSGNMPTPKTVASATTIAPDTFLTFVTGTLQIATITPPVNGTHMLVLLFSDASPGTMLTTGNILNAVVPTPNVPTFMVYDPTQRKYYGAAGNVT